MTVASLIAQIHSLELQLAVLKAELTQSVRPLPAKTAADLYGICAGPQEARDEDLEAVKYRLKWEQREDEGPST